jgi:hypothetical protein
MFRGFTLAAAGLLLYAGGNAVRADGDVIRLGGKGDAGATTLGLSGAVDTHLTRGYGGHGGHYGGHAHYGGYGHYGYRGYGNYGGYRGFYGGYYRPYYSYYRPYYGYGYGYYRPYYYARYAYPYYGGYYGGYGNYYGGYGSSYGGYGSSYGGYGGYGGYYPYYSGYNYPCVVTPGYTMNVAPYNGTGPEQLQAPNAPFMPPADKNQTFPYDGGPTVPLPKASDSAPASEPVPRPTLPRDGRIAAKPLPSPYTFTAYGQLPNQGKVVTVVIGTPAPLPSPYAATTAKVERPAATPTTTASTKIAYPAYGEQPLSPPVRIELTRSK